MEIQHNAEYLLLYVYNQLDVLCCGILFIVDWQFVTNISGQPIAVVYLVEALRHKTEGRGFDSWWWHLSFSLT